MLYPPSILILLLHLQLKKRIIFSPEPSSPSHQLWYY